MKELTTYTFTTSDYELLSKPFPINPCDLCANDTYGDRSSCDDCQRMRDYIASLNSYKNKNILELASVIHNISHNLTEVLEDLFLISKDLDTINDYVKHASDESDDLGEFLAKDINNPNDMSQFFRTFKSNLYAFFLSQIKYNPNSDISFTQLDINKTYEFMNHFQKYYESFKNKPTNK